MVDGGGGIFKREKRRCLAWGKRGWYGYLMKMLLAVLGLSLLGGSAFAQSFVFPVPSKKQEVVPVQKITPKPSIEGIVKEIFVTKKPWQLVNPAAPAHYGTGEKMVSKDSGPGTPYHSTGWVLAGLEW